MPDDETPLEDIDIGHADWRAAQYTREQWLNEMLGQVLDRFVTVMPAEWKPPRMRVSCGWPGVTHHGRVECVLGVCYDKAGSTDGTYEIFISPMLTAIEAVGTLCHEVAHAVAGCENQHNAEYVRVGSMIGLTGDPEHLEPGPDLRHAIEQWIDSAPVYPHAPLTPPPPDPPAGAGRGPQPTRLLKAACASCGYVIRLTMKWTLRGLPTCPCGTEFVLAEPKE